MTCVQEAHGKRDSDSCKGIRMGVPPSCLELPPHAEHLRSCTTEGVLNAMDLLEKQCLTAGTW